MYATCAAAEQNVLHAHSNVCKCIGRSKSWYLQIYSAMTKYINIAISITIPL